MDTFLPFEEEIVKACIIYDSNTKYCIVLYQGAHASINIYIYIIKYYIYKQLSLYTYMQIPKKMIIF
jgi:hypothetical protein